MSGCLTDKVYSIGSDFVIIENKLFKIVSENVDNMSSKASRRA